MKLAILVAAAALTAAARPQPAFEAASVKHNRAPSPRGARLQLLPSGRVSIANIPLYMIVAFAYNVPFQGQTERLTGGPDWLRSETYDIEATPDKSSLPPEMSTKERNEKMKLMLRSLLADRFHMNIVRSTKEMPVYELVVAKNGPKLKPAGVTEKDCAEGAKIDPPCHQLSGGIGRGIHGKAADLDDVVRMIENWSDRPIVNHTGLNGLFEFDTEGWVPMNAAPPMPGTTPTPESIAMADPARPTLFLVMDGLGLKLQPAKAPVDLYIIEHAERPTEN